MLLNIIQTGSTSLQITTSVINTITIKYYYLYVDFNEVLLHYITHYIKLEVYIFHKSDEIKIY